MEQKLKKTINQMSRCSVCMDTAVDPYCCTNSHVVCFLCMTKLSFECTETQKCPTCRDVCAFRVDRNLKTLCDMSRSGSRRCNFNDCTVNYDEKSNHHMTCVQRPFECIHCLVYKRRNKYTSTSDIEFHYSESHPTKRMTPPTGIHSTMNVSTLIRRNRSNRDCLLGSTFILRMLATPTLNQISIGGLIVCESSRSGTHAFYLFSFGTNLAIRVTVDMYLHNELYARYTLKPRPLSKRFRDPAYSVDNAIKLPSSTYNDVWQDLKLDMSVCEVSVMDIPVKPVLTDYTNRPTVSIGQKVTYVTSDLRDTIEGVVTKDLGEGVVILTQKGEISVTDKYYNLFAHPDEARLIEI